MNKSEIAAHERRAKALGMHFSTASAKLKRLIMFSLIQETGRDICFVCNKPIEKEDDFSIEHMLPWESRDVDLFWDLNNIAFSHKKCNRPHRHTNVGPSLRIVGPEGTSWCYRCKDFHPVEMFSADQYRWNGLRAACCRVIIYKNLKYI